ncbi:PQQ-binding-like beta-propeller repeat protein [Paenibacillus sp. CF384]|uniref:outer membrane protein assembly factor BamB family protein n=1 Tax=Paenibacillus sp. CF384 TaxID=1884382 RepID=UPI00089672A7|nr:PQQ-binding-like beta-propeller repeat protein [Paenibacillus sp. CF384]SDX62410.1 PQQ enzyme repeat-containing protein [Paenibacillus sp. CF384]
MKSWKHTTLTLVAAGLLMSGTAAATASAQTNPDPNTSYDGQTMPAVSNKVPFAKPIWTIELDKPTIENSYQAPIVIENSIFFTIKGGVLQARTIQTGKLLWSYGTKLQAGAIQLLNGSLYVSGQDGSVYQVAAQTGTAKRIYQANKKSTFSQFKVEGNTLYFASSLGLVSVNLATGHERWRNTDVNSIPVKVGGKLLVLAMESGAITVTTTYAIDEATGKTIWRLAGSHSNVLKVDGEKLYFVNDWPKSDTTKFLVDLDVVDLQTGSVIETKSFVPVKQGEDPMYQYASKLVIEGNDVYVSTKDHQLYHYNLNADPSVVKPEIIQDDGTWIAGPYNGKLIYKNGDNIGLHARKIVDHTPVFYQGLDNPASRVDLIDSGLYVGQTDGEVYALNVATGKALSRYQTSARSFGPFQVEGDKLLVQAEGKLYAFTLPAELRKPISGTGLGTGAFSKAAASLSIDGQLKKFEPSMMTTGNRMLVPLRFLVGEIGATTSYNTQTKQTTVTRGDRSIILAEGAPFATVGSRQTPLSFAPVILGGSLYIPVSDIGKLLGVEVKWNGGTRTVEVSTEVAG